MKETSLIRKVGETVAPWTVRQVTLEGFRNYSEAVVALSDGFNVVAGPNAQGKTNFLEALYLVGTTRLLRGQRDVEAIFDGKSQAVVTAELESTTRLGIKLERGIRKRAQLNGLPLPRAADLIGRLPVVCVSTIDMVIVTGEPADRRMFLDLELSGLSPAYLRHFTLYRRALDQRNALLRDSREWMQPPALWEPWEEQLAHHGSLIRQSRREYLDRLRPATQEVHATMGDGERIEMNALQKDDATDEDSLREALASSRGADIARGSTTVGPHRDDLILQINGRDARLFGSQGQQRTAVISLKLASLRVAREELGGPPLLLLDDILSDLDETRRARLVSVVIDQAGQAVLTCTEAAAAGREILDQARLFEVCAGHMEQR